MTEAMAKATSQRHEAERKLATFGDDTWHERLKHSIGGGTIAAVMGFADAAIMATPLAPGTRSRYNVPQIPADNMPSHWWDRTAREHGLDTRGPAYNLAELSTIIAASFVPVGGPGKSVTVIRSGTVWDHVLPTQPNYPGLTLPKSFEMTAGSSKVWVTPNASKHLDEYVSKLVERGLGKDQIDLITQVQLSSLKAALDAILARKVSYGHMYLINGWELILSRPREPGLFPAVVHAVPKGSS